MEHRTQQVRDESKRRRETIEKQAKEKSDTAAANALQDTIENAKLGPFPGQREARATQSLKMRS